MNSNKIEINEETCVKCGACQKLCPRHKFDCKPGEAVKVLEERSCTGCGQCASACPTRSISLNGVTPEKLFIPDGTAEAVKSLVLTRRSVRCFKPEHIPREKLEEILNTASSGCPSGCNSRRCNCTVITGIDKLNAIAAKVIDNMEKTGAPQFKPLIEMFKKEFNPITYNAPHLLVIWGRKMKSPFGEDSKEIAFIDTGIQSETIDLLLSANGYGSVYVGLIGIAGVDKELKSLLHVPEDAEPLICMALGVPGITYPNATPRTPHVINFVE